MAPEPSALRKILSRYTEASAPELVRPLEDGRLQCLACGHRCRIAEGQRGVCEVRFVQGGILRRPHGYVAGMACDPIEKKPFFHAWPGCGALTFGMLGCDLHCPYCQNWITSQALRDGEAGAGVEPVDPEDLVEAAVRQGARVVTSSYNEPLITADWAVEVFRRAHARGLACAFVSNGNATPEVLEYIRPHVDLFKVDFKCFQDESYRRLGCRSQNVLDTIRRLKELGFWVEVVTLVVPGFNDSSDELRSMAGFLSSVDPMIPWHVTAFHPDYRMTDRDRTPVEALERARDLGREVGLRYIYLGNVAGSGGEDTHCHACAHLLVRRRGFHVLENRLQGGACPACGAAIPGRWDERSSAER